MGKKPTEPKGDGLMTIPAAVSHALRAVLPDRGVLPIAKKIGLSNSTLRRLAEGKLERIDAAHIAKLRGIYGFSAEFDRLVGDDEPDAQALDIARRLMRAYPDGGSELVVEGIEDLAPHLDPQALADMLRAQKLLLRRQRQPEPPPSPAKNLPEAAKKLPKRA